MSCTSDMIVEMAIISATPVKKQQDIRGSESGELMATQGHQHAETASTSSVESPMRGKRPRHATTIEPTTAPAPENASSLL